jgi:hypothetical protein
MPRKNLPIDENIYDFSGKTASDIISRPILWVWEEFVLAI